MHLVLSHEGLSTDTISNLSPLGDINSAIYVQSVVHISILFGICNEVCLILFNGLAIDVQCSSLHVVPVVHNFLELLRFHLCMVYPRLLCHLECPMIGRCLCITLFAFFVKAAG